MMDSNWVAGTRYTVVIFGSWSMTVDLPSQASEAKIVHLRRDGVSSFSYMSLCCSRKPQLTVLNVDFSTRSVCNICAQKAHLNKNKKKLK